MSGRSKRSCRDSSHAYHIGEIEEITVNILSKLPASSVLKCEKVSESWCQLIREPQFPQLQFTCSAKNPKFLLQRCGDNNKDHNNLYLMDRYGKRSKYVTLSFCGQDCSLRVISSFNGLICCTSLTTNDDLNISICNPVTQKYHKVPEGSPSATTPSVGVIFDPNGNKYKVLRFFKDAFASDDSDDSDESDTEEINYDCEIYSPDGGGWSIICRNVQQPVANPASPLFPTSVCVGGRLYWLAWSEEQPGVPSHILAVNMNGTLSKILLPTSFDDGPVEINLFAFLIEYKGQLALVCVYDLEVSVDVWSLTDPMESQWVFEGHADMEIYTFIIAINSIVSIEDELLFVIEGHLAPHFGFHFLNMATLTWRKLEIPKFKVGICEPVVYPYSESLFRCDAK